MQDRENKEATDAIVETSMKQVTLLQEKHGQGVSNIREKAEQSLIKDYQVQNAKNCIVMRFMTRYVTVKFCNVMARLINARTKRQRNYL